VGILSDFFVAAPDQITEEHFRRGPAGTYPTVQAKRFTPVEMVELLQVVRPDHPGGATGQRHAFPLVLTCPSGEAWVVSCPADLRDALAEASADDLIRYASRWAEADQLRFIGMDATALAALLADLAPLARLGQVRNEALYLWMSL
jgi:hypothetical protein